MTAVESGSTNAVVAIGATAGDAGMVNRCAGPRHGGVALVARVGCNDVGVGILAARERAVVAGGTQRSRLRMVKSFGGLPQCRRHIMATLACIARRQSGVVFASRAILPVHVGKRAAVATHAAQRQRRVVHLGTEPGGDGVATGATQRGRNVRRRSLAGCQDGVMAIRARAQPLRVIKLHFVGPQAREGLVARLTCIAGIQSFVMLSAFAAGVHLVVARHAIVDERAVIHRRRLPRGGGVADVALLNCRDMVELGFFTGRDHVVVANHATARQIGLRVVHLDLRAFPHRHAQVTRFAHVARLDMSGVLGGGVDARSMAERTIVGDVQFFVSKRMRQPGGGGMTEVA